MSHLESSNFSFIKKIIRDYYSTKPLKEPVYIHKREIAIHSLEDDKYIRHLAFPSMTNLYKYITSQKTPLHLYYSSALYETPNAENMEAKGWEGSELMFDIDSDKFPGCDQSYTICLESNTIMDGKYKECPGGGEPINYPMVSEKCVERAYVESLKLYSVLREEFGFRDIEIYFTGNRGFHIKVYDESVLDLSSNERREIVSYLTLDNIDLTNIAPVIGSREKYVLVSSKDHGIRRRIYKLAMIVGGDYEEINEYIKIPVEILNQIIDELRIVIDPVVTIDPSRLSRFINSLNCKSGLRVSRIDIDRFERFDYREYSPFEGGLIVKPLIDASLPVYGEVVKLRRNETIYLDAPIGLYLLFKNLVKIINTRDFGVKKCTTCT